MGEDQLQIGTDTLQQEILKLSEALISCQRELAQVRAAEEPLREQCSQLLREREEAISTAEQLADALARHLSTKFWEERRPPARIGWGRFIGSRWPWLKKTFGARQSAEELEEQARVRMIEASPLFDAGWYLRQNLDVVGAGIHPASHFLHAGAGEARNPGPEFDTAAYLARHPELVESGVNPLLHQLQSPHA